MNDVMRDFIKLFDKFEDFGYEDGKNFKILYPSVFFKERKLYYDSNRQISDVLYLFCMKGDMKPNMKLNDSLELRLNPIIGDLFKILLLNKKYNYLRNANSNSNLNSKPFLDSLTSEKFVENINHKLAEKLKVFKRLQFGNSEYAIEMENLNLTNNQIKQMEKLEKAQLNLFYVKHSGLAKALDLLEKIYKDDNGELDIYRIDELGIDKLEKLLEEKQKIEGIKSWLSKEQQTPKRNNISRKLKHQKTNTPDNQKIKKTKVNTVSTVLLNRQIQRRNSNLPPELNFTKK